MAGYVVLQGTLHPPSCPLQKYLSDATIHVDPATESGTDHPHVAEHSHEGLHPISH
jgi:hypothetical protein